MSEPHFYRHMDNPASKTYDPIRIEIKTETGSIQVRVDPLTVAKALMESNYGAHRVLSHLIDLRAEQEARKGWMSTHTRMLRDLILSGFY